MLIDSARITIKAGNGGHGMIAFRRERFVPKGGPSGGNGGAGGDITLQVDAQLGTLRDINYRRNYKAERGKHGAGANKDGHRGKSVTIRVPPGTLVKDSQTGEILADMTSAGDTFIAARGGSGGFGNSHFKSPRNRSPHEATDGEPGEQRELDLELKLLADVGLVGLPNAGKSTLLSRLSAAKPKIAAYPFTTLEPNLGIVKYGDYKSFVMADIPGLIEGASEGKGLGHQFLRHIERTQVLVYLIDASAPEPIMDQLRILQDELSGYAAQLGDRPAVVALTKEDAWPEPIPKQSYASIDYPVVAISAVTGAGLDQLMIALVAELKNAHGEVLPDSNNQANSG